jgi:hypothetical protein
MILRWSEQRHHSKETYYQCQKRPIPVSKETHNLGGVDLLPVLKETYFSVKRDLLPWR